VDGADFIYEYKQRVKLKDQDFSGFIPYQGQSTVGCSGWITQRRRDNLGLPQVYIEWDKDDWRYNGTPDCWTYQEHFEAEESDIQMTEQPTKTDQVQAAVQAFTDMMLELVGEQPTDASVPQPQMGAAIETPSPKERLMMQAIDLLTETPAFVLIAVNEKLQPVVIPYSESAEAAIVVSSHMSQLAAKAHQSLAQRTLAKTI
jgi:hypothetical protein